MAGQFHPVTLQNTPEDYINSNVTLYFFMDNNGCKEMFAAMISNACAPLENIVLHVAHDI